MVHHLVGDPVRKAFDDFVELGRTLRENGGSHTLAGVAEHARRCRRLDVWSDQLLSARFLEVGTRTGSTSPSYTATRSR